MAPSGLVRGAVLGTVVLPLGVVVRVELPRRATPRVQTLTVRRTVFAALASAISHHGAIDHEPLRRLVVEVPLRGLLVALAPRALHTVEDRQHPIDAQAR